ncbi:MAG: endonuclease/exonuclease/phosphatase family protein, partial [Verrucomicrobiota bacterium]
AAARALPSEGGTVSISPGVYRETVVLDTSATLVAPSGGVVIGDLTTGIATTSSFQLLTWNTHLFGDTLLAPTWKDAERAEQIGDYLARHFSELDLVSLCEVWDEDFFVGDWSGAIQPRSGYSNWMMYTEIQTGTVPCISSVPIIGGVFDEAAGIVSLPRFIHSGLALLAKHPLDDQHRVHYEACEGKCPGKSESPDCLASKGFMAATVVKDGFRIRIYDTHTQAGYASDYIEARQKQVAQLAGDIAAFRSGHPDHVILVMGDMNVIGEDPAGHNTSDYNFLRDQFGALGGRDAARHAANVSIYNDFSLGHTLTSANALALHFDPPHDERLDYIWYFASLDGKSTLYPLHVERLMPRGRSLEGDNLRTEELSDHYPITANFRLIKLP